MYRLYYAPGAASLVVHWLLIEMGQPHALQRVDMDARQQKSAEYLALNPNGTVPTLIADGRPLYEAAALVLYLADRHAEAGLAPAVGDPQRGEYCQWLLNLANTVQSPMRLWWYPQDLHGLPEDAVREAARRRVEAAWERLDAHLAARGPYLLGERVSAVDFYLVMLMRWTRKMPRPGDAWPHLGALAGRMKARPSFAALYEREGLSEWR
ncbi:glutathione S-transferase family protein [Vulcaniibacterium tengchongense]|uniref:Glutathione S-transferase n=1 Tax=Vulcaniibacterium tengchongense TaxID=1273429 RepID=A0A3N4VRP1_9GAMM|nr:glutathione S-transferase family protein [Vulcaniibacterium tengchongense]RPE81881.1 glutathione S-transferase [Vulcaniibacterium tengchongense]